MEFLNNSTIVVGIAFLCFVGVLFYFKVPAMLAAALDKRAAAIREELDEARRLRDEAQRQLAVLERKLKEADGEIAEIVAHARMEAEESAALAKENLKATVARRLKAAEEQIAAAESAAIKEVKDKAVSIAIAVAADVISGNMTDAARADMTDASIEQIGAKLH